jgi:signal transduction histidine kinase
LRLSVRLKLDMDIYNKRSRWKIYLAVAGALIVLISTLYSNYLARQIAEEEKKKVQLYLDAQAEIEEVSLYAMRLQSQYPEAPEPSFTFLFSIIKANTTIPVLLVGENGDIQDALNYGKIDSLGKERELQRFIAAGTKPIISNAGQGLYFKESTLLTQLRYFPLLQLGLIGAFIIIGYLAFSSARRAQENRVWVGMAKETAHQLGTPISAIIGWIEHMKMIREEDEEILEVAEELRNDVTRLELVADRFSKIGSEPELRTINVYDEIEKCRVYMERRAPRKVKFNFPDPTANTAINFNINPHLFDWVVENLLRNALDAMDGKGEISAAIYEDSNDVFIDISDTGTGIPANKFTSVFNPGFTTKKRGWGLGLSLAKRIIEKYHTGKIFVKKSVENKGTTFTIQLPKSRRVKTL